MCSLTSSSDVKTVGGELGVAPGLVPLAAYPTGSRGIDGERWERAFDLKKDWR